MTRTGAPLRGAGPETAGVRVPATAFVLAGVLWIVGDAAEIVGFSSGSGDPGALLLLVQAVFVLAGISYALALLSGATIGLAGRSIPGRWGLLVTAACFLFILVATTSAMLGFPNLAPALTVIGPLRNVAEVVAGVGILVAGALPRPARAIYLVYALALLMATVVDRFLPSSGEGPGFVAEVGQAVLWILIGGSLLRPTAGRGRGWFLAAVGVGALVVASVAIPH